jgi:hypothetical protein
MVSASVSSNWRHWKLGCGIISKKDGLIALKNYDVVIHVTSHSATFYCD